ncbi:MAG: tRNA lysidine(34) synthetase TilS [Clostridia bacterium]|nr:tRNA lysidine(34) synthetase TilS [Clostridia bacterium]
MTADEFSTRLSSDCALAPGSHVLVALSGGADSTALLCLFLKIAGRYPLRVSCAHVEHGIRGEASLCDLAFVRALCEEKSVPLYCAHVDAPSYSCAHRCGMEDAARRLRYAFLHETADAIGADAIALAHHAGDQQETVLLHAMRGSDVKGLCAMRYRSGRLIRPLLDETPQALRAYLLAKGQDWREDESNADTAYLRNRIRHEILPEMEKAVPGAGAALCRLARAAQRDEDYFSAQLDTMDFCEIPLADGLAVSGEKLKGLHPALLSRALVRLIGRAGIKPQSADAIEAVMDALDKGGEIVNLSGGAHAWAGENYLCLTRAEEEIPITALNVPGQTETPLGKFVVRPALEGETGDGKRSQRMPLRLLQGAYVSSRREGDVMIPFGKHTPVKLKKLMIDAHIERAMRKSVPLVRDRQGRILWAVGLRPADCCRPAGNEEQMIVCFCRAWPCADEE